MLQFTRLFHFTVVVIKFTQANPVTKDLMCEHQQEEKMFDWTTIFYDFSSVVLLKEYLMRPVFIWLKEEIITVLHTWREFYIPVRWHILEFKHFKLGQ